MSWLSCGPTARPEAACVSDAEQSPRGHSMRGPRLTGTQHPSVAGLGLPVPRWDPAACVSAASREEQPQGHSKRKGTETLRATDV